MKAIRQGLVGGLLLLGLALEGCGERFAPLTPDSSPVVVASKPDGTEASGTSGGSPGGSGSGRGSGGHGGKTQNPTVTCLPKPVTNIVETDSELIGPKGGKLQAGDYELDIPEGALENPVSITLNDISGVTGRVEVELLPHGLHFAVPVELTVKLPDGVNADQLTLFWIVNEGLPTEIWAPMPTRSASEGTKIIAQLTHFSVYAPGTLDGKAGWKVLPGRGAQTLRQEGEGPQP